MGGDNGRFSGTTIKDTWKKTTGGWNQGKEVGMAGVGWRGDEGRQTTLLEQQQKKQNKESKAG